MKITIVLILSLLAYFLSFSQTGQVVVKKVNSKKDDKFYFELRYVSSSKILKNNNYALDGFDKLDDSIKLQFVDKLLSFEGGTSLCVGSPYPHYFSNNAQNRYFAPKSIYQTMEVNALYFINRIAFNYYTDYYAPAPVLFDKKLGIEINNDPKKIKIVFETYKEWFKKCKLAGEISKDFPFNDGRYV